MKKIDRQEWLSEYAPWLKPYDRIAAVTPIDVHAANHMLRKVQLLRSNLSQQQPEHPLVLADHKVVCDSVAKYVIDKTANDAIGLGADEMAALFAASQLAARINLREQMHQLTTKIVSSLEQRELKFEQFATREIAIRYPDMPEALQQKRVNTYVHAFHVDFGKPLFSRDFKMSENRFEGVKTLAEDDKKEYEEFKRVFGFGVDSSSAETRRFKLHLETQLRRQYPDANDEAIAAKIKNKEHGASIERSYKEAETARSDFARFTRDFIQQRDQFTPDERMRRYQAVMRIYDTEHGSPRISHPLRDDIELHKAIKNRYGIQQNVTEDSHVDQLKKDGSGRDDGPRESAPKKSWWKF